MSGGGCRAWLGGFGKVDIVAVANGKIISHMRTQVVQPFETASVTSILVSPGQRVRAGDPMIELDKTVALAERVRAQSDLVAALLDEMRLRRFSISPRPRLSPPSPRPQPSMSIARGGATVCADSDAR